MQTTAFLPLSPAIKSVTIIASIIILLTMGYMAYQWYTTKQAMLLVTFVIVAIALLSCMVLIPRKLTVTTDKEINIHLLAWEITIPADEIVKIEHYPNGIQSSRIAGAGGFFGNLGLFTCKECGKHLSLITDPKDVFIITRKSKMPIVVSIKDNSVFKDIAKVQERN